MDEELEKAVEPTKGVWKRISSVVSSPLTSVSKMTKESPAMILIAILLVVQPIVQTGIELVKGLIEFKQDLDPNNRPVTKAELDVINSKIDFLEKLVLADTKADHDRLDEQNKWLNSHKHPGIANTPPVNAPPANAAPPLPADFDDLSKKLADVEHHADEDFRLHPPKK